MDESLFKPSLVSLLQVLGHEPETFEEAMNRLKASYSDGWFIRDKCIPSLLNKKQWILVGKVDLTRCTKKFKTFKYH